MVDPTLYCGSFLSPIAPHDSYSLCANVAQLIFVLVMDM